MQIKDYINPKFLSRTDNSFHFCEFHLIQFTAKLSLYTLPSERETYQLKAFICKILYIRTGRVTVMCTIHSRIDGSKLGTGHIHAKIWFRKFSNRASSTGTSAGFFTVAVIITVACRQSQTHQCQNHNYIDKLNILHI